MKKPSYKFSLRTFRDDEIQQLMDADNNFRELHIGHRDNLLEDMNSGKWADNASPVIFSESGKLLDGQHRLSAAQLYQRKHNGDPVWFWVVEGMDEKTALVIDVGRRRTFTDYMTHHEVANATYVGAIVRNAVIMTKRPRGTRLWGMFGAPQVQNGNGIKQSVSASLLQMVDYFKRNRKAIEEWAVIGRSLGGKGRMPAPAMLASVGYQLALVDEVSAKLFFDALVTGEGFKDTDVLYLLRERLQKERTSAAKVRPIHLAALVVKAWVAWMTGVTPSKLMWNSSGPKSEDFPDHRITKE